MFSHGGLMTALCGHTLSLFIEECFCPVRSFVEKGKGVVFLVCGVFVEIVAMY